ncbi:hypothetical protein GUY44_07645 [Pimelobacter simplex]|uniref:Uncharacterized protein n=1 Tax=Nocardioides simplex TaxID=2045 RepID=A0A0C5XFS9_NOCSI|nr:hypothetical protein [Pimelobacter simplex]AJR18021.1 hypothetical protein KR76_00013 [Pimelobacter simplex]MCG8150348.1 hypothetical protein [Pimelobacter simplex]SFM89597.1 hypothetical protein SAMN05421671_4070 [Pimelobacter simplex]
MTSHIQSGDPDSIVCRWCKGVRSVRRRGETTFRLCPTCDARADEVDATWETESTP